RFFFIIPVLVIYVSTSTKGGRAVWTMPTRKVDFRVSWGLAAIIVYGTVWLARNVFSLQPLTLPRNDAPYVDESFHQALIGELMHRFPPQIPFLLGTKLDYHWFVHAQLAATEWGTHIDTLVLLRELAPVAFLALTILGLGAVALRLGGRPFAAFAAPALIVAGGFNLIGPHFNTATFLEPFLTNRYVFSPSESYGVMMCLPPLMLLLEVLHPSRQRRRLVWWALALTLFALSGSKATFMPIFLCAAVGLWFLQLLLHRKVDRTVSAVVGLLAVVTAWQQLILFGGVTGGMPFDPMGTVRVALVKQHIVPSPATYLTMTATMLIAWLLYGVGVYGLRRDKLWRDRRSLWMLITIPTGIAVAFVFNRPGGSQLWFQRAVAPMVVLLSVWGLCKLLPNPVTKRVVIRLSAVALGAGLFAFVVSSILEAHKHNIRIATPHSLLYTVLVPVIVVVGYACLRVLWRHHPRNLWLSPVTPVVLLLGLGLTHVYSTAYDTVTRRPEPHHRPHPLFAKGGFTAAKFVAKHAGIDDVLATNVHCMKPKAKHCDNRNFWISAYTQRRIVVEGWGYTAPTTANYIKGVRNGFIPMPFPKRLAVNDAAVEHPSKASIDRLVKLYDVKWLFVSKAYPVDLTRLNELTGVVRKAFHNPNYAVFKIIQNPTG
ncbi:MAG: hypothetical protein ACRDPG_11345, partial [Nocardioidaceae bacterium]